MNTFKIIIISGLIILSVSGFCITPPNITLDNIPVSFTYSSGNYELNKNIWTIDNANYSLFYFLDFKVTGTYSKDSMDLTLKLASPLPINSISSFITPYYPIKDKISGTLTGSFRISKKAGITFIQPDISLDDFTGLPQKTGAKKLIIKGIWYSNRFYLNHAEISHLFSDISKTLPENIIISAPGKEVCFNKTQIELSKALLKLNNVPLYLTGKYLLKDSSYNLQISTGKDLLIENYISLMEKQFNISLKKFRFSGKTRIIANVDSKKQNQNKLFVLLKNAKSNLPDFPISLDSINGKISIDKNKAVFQNLSMKIDSAKANLTGSWNYSQKNKLLLTFTSQNMSVNSPIFQKYLPKDNKLINSVKGFVDIQADINSAKSNFIDKVTLNFRNISADTSEYPKFQLWKDSFGVVFQSERLTLSDLFLSTPFGILTSSGRISLNPFEINLYFKPLNDYADFSVTKALEVDSPFTVKANDKEISMDIPSLRVNSIPFQKVSFTMGRKDNDFFKGSAYSSSTLLEFNGSSYSGQWASDFLISGSGEMTNLLQSLAPCNRLAASNLTIKGKASGNKMKGVSALTASLNATNLFINGTSLQNSLYKTTQIPFILDFHLDSLTSGITLNDQGLFLNDIAFMEKRIRGSGNRFTIYKNDSLEGYMRFDILREILLDKIIMGEDMNYYFKYLPDDYIDLVFNIRGTIQNPDAQFDKRKFMSSRAGKKILFGMHLPPSNSQTPTRTQQVPNTQKAPTPEQLLLKLLLGK